MQRQVTNTIIEFPTEIVRQDVINQRFRQTCIELERQALKNYKGSRYPSGEVLCKGTRVQMAVGMYQFEDLIQSHFKPDKYILADNWGFLNC